MPLANPEALAARQVELDRERTRRFPSLFLRKQSRMSASPFAFLRGAAPLFYKFLGQSPGPPGAPPARAGSPVTCISKTSAPTALLVRRASTSARQPST